MTPTISGLSTQTLLKLSHKYFGRVSTPRLRIMEKKGSVHSLPSNLPNLEKPCVIFILFKANIITMGPKIYVSKFPPGFMLQMYLYFFNFENIHGITYIFFALCYSTSYNFRFPSRSNRIPLDTLDVLVTSLINQYKKWHSL